MGVLQRYQSGVTAGADEAVWPQMLDYWVSTGQLDGGQVGADPLTEAKFRALGFEASYGPGSFGRDLQNQRADWWLRSDPRTVGKAFLASRPATSLAGWWRS